MPFELKSKSNQPKTPGMVAALKNAMGLMALACMPSSAKWRRSRAKFPNGPCRYPGCNQPDVKRGRETGVYLCEEHHELVLKEEPNGNANASDKIAGTSVESSNLDVPKPHAM